MKVTMNRLILNSRNNLKGKAATQNFCKHWHKMRQLAENSNGITCKTLVKIDETKFCDSNVAYKGHGKNGARPSLILSSYI